MMANSAPGTPKTKHRRKFSMGSYNFNKDKDKEKEKKRLSKKELSESDESDDDTESDHTNNSEDSKYSPYKQKAPAPTKPESKRSRGWELMEGLRDGQTCETRPEKFEGFMMKRRKWPMKGWHKRFFVLENGILTYAKSPNDILKGKYHGSVDTGLLVLAYKRSRKMIDIDADDVIYHLKVSGKSIQNQFEKWIDQFRHHRLYRQHEIAFGTNYAPKLTDVNTPVEELATPITSPVQTNPAVAMSERSARGSFKQRASTKVTAWLLDASGMETTHREIQEAQAKIYELGDILSRLQSLSANGASNGAIDQHLESPGESSTAGKKEKTTKPGRGLKFKPGRKKVQDELTTLVAASGAMGVSIGVPNGAQALHGSSSNPNLAGMEARARPVTLPDPLTHTASAPVLPADQLVREDFLRKSKSIHEQLKHLCRTIMTERERLKQAITHNNAPVPPNTNSYIAALKNALNEANRQNEDYRARLTRIHTDSNVLSTITSPTLVPSQDSVVLPPERKISSAEKMLSASASWESQSGVSEFYDAEEYHLSSSSSSEDEEEDDNEENEGSDVSDMENTVVPNSDEEQFEFKRSMTGRRCKLPVPKSEDSNISLFGLLRRNIGKDLSKISMPVSLNEPLSMLQRMCEELEYSELLDKAADTEDPVQRMCLVAAFSVSPYASTYYRAGQKPFNPLLGETYECIREDKGWRFIAEQVSHHPPIAAGYCESKNFVFWQDMRVKTKFWGKSMELQPLGNVQLKLPKYKDHYTWNKATTCVHNLLGGQRWVDHYGEVNITNKANGISCKLMYSKSSYWSSSRHEVYGTVSAPGKEPVNLFGKWNEGFYFGKNPSSAKCIWRPGSMPEDYDLYYGFTRFAMELNELERDQVHLYAPTDTRFRKDQRLLEEGRLEEAEMEKHRVEHMQRERRKQREAEKSSYSPRWFLKSEEDKQDIYMYTGKYFDLRKDPAFSRLKFPELW